MISCKSLMGHFFIKTLKNCLKISLSYMSRLSIINFIRENVIEGLTLVPFNFFLWVYASSNWSTRITRSTHQCKKLTPHFVIQEHIAVSLKLGRKIRDFLLLRFLISFTSSVPRKTGRKIVITQWHQKITVWFIVGSRT